MLAGARALLVTAGLLAVYLDPASAAADPVPAGTLLAVYAAQSYFLLIVSFVTILPAAVRTALHWADLAWAGGLVLATSGPNSPFYAFFVFVLLSAAYRWGLRGTLMTGVAASVFVLWQAAPLAESGAVGLTVRPAYLLILAALAGYLSEEEKRRRAEATSVSRLLSLIRAERGMGLSFMAVGRTLMELTGTSRLVLAVEEVSTGRWHRWTIDDRESTEVALPAEMSADERAIYLSGAPPGVWLADRERVVDASGAPAARRVAAHLWTLHPFAGVLSVTADFPGLWRARLFAFTRHRPRLRQLRLLAELVGQIRPAMYSLYVLRRLRSRVGNLERARLARELHDGPVQSLLALGLQAAEVRRRIARGERPEPGLERLERQLHAEALAVRDLMQQIRPVVIAPRELPAYLEELVSRFRVEAGIDAQFVPPPPGVEMPSAWACRELASIAREALVNVRKHAAARHVVVRLDQPSDGWLLLIDSDGSGFEFNGRYTLQELDAMRRGPIVIKERVRAMGATLTIDSRPGHGASIEVLLPFAGRRLSRIA